MRVCIASTTFPLRKGHHTGSFVFEQARELVQQGVELRVIAPHAHGVPLYEIIENVPVYRYRYFLPERLQTLCYGSGMPENIKVSNLAKIQLPFLILTTAIQIAAQAKDYQIIHTHSAVAGLAGIIAGKLISKPVIMTHHHGSTRRLSSIEKYVMENVDYLLCNSSFTLANVLKYAKPKSYKINSPGVDINKFSPISKGSISPDIAERIPPATLIIFSLGRLIDLKGHKYLIEALSLMDKKINTHLIIGGDGELMGDLHRHAREKWGEDRVTFLGTIPHEKAREWLAASDVYVQPSIIDKNGNTEGLGMTVIEALACGIPCIGSRVGGITEIIEDGVDGYLFEPGNPRDLAEKLLALLDDEGRRREMGASGRKKVVERFSWEAKNRELIEVYNHIVEDF